MSMHDPIAAGTPGATDLSSADPIALLEEDHEAVDALFRKAEDAGLDPTTELLRDIADLVTAHAVLEEELIYPLLPPELGSRSAAEHATVRDLVAVLLAAPPSSDEAAELLAELIANVRGHVADERADVFPALEDALSHDERRALGAWLAASKGAGTPTSDADYPVADASVSSDDSPDYIEGQDGASG